MNPFEAKAVELPSEKDINDVLLGRMIELEKTNRTLELKASRLEAELASFLNVVETHPAAIDRLSEKILEFEAGNAQLVARLALEKTAKETALRYAEDLTEVRQGLEAKLAELHKHLELERTAKVEALKSRDELAKIRGDLMAKSFRYESQHALKECETLTNHVAQSEKPEKTTSRKLDGLDVLLVEDDMDTRELVASLLEQFGAAVTAVASAREAFEVFGRAKPDVLISDIMMPDEDGYALIGKIRALTAEQGGNVPALAMTACNTTEDRERLLAAGFQLHMPKPVQCDDLAVAVANVAAQSGFEPGVASR